MTTVSSETVSECNEVMYSIRRTEKKFIQEFSLANLPFKNETNKNIPG